MPCSYPLDELSAINSIKDIQEKRLKCGSNDIDRANLHIIEEKTIRPSGGLRSLSALLVLDIMFTGITAIIY